MITKKPAASGKSTSVTFTLPADAATESACVVGTFNEWNAEKHPMKKDAKKGVWSKAISLKPGRYEFRYLVDGDRWINDDGADGTAETPFFSENSVVEV